MVHEFMYLRLVNMFEVAAVKLMISNEWLDWFVHNLSKAFLQLVYNFLRQTVGISAICFKHKYSKSSKWGLVLLHIQRYKVISAN